MSDDTPFAIISGEAEAMMFGRDPDGTFHCRRHDQTMEERPDPDGNPGIWIAVCPTCEARAAEIRGAINEALDTP
jgi:hypothetical protein